MGSYQVVRMDEATVRNAKAQGKPAKYRDEKTGLLLIVGVGGRKSFFVRSTINGKDRQTKIGIWGQVTLSEAKKLASDALHDMGKGVDPALGSRREGMTLRDAYKLHLSHLVKDGGSAKTLRRYESTTKIYFADWMSRKLATISREDVLTLHTRIAAMVQAGERSEGRHEGRVITSGSFTGRHTANDAMRIFRAVYNTARELHPEICPRIQAAACASIGSTPRSARPPRLLRTSSDYGGAPSLRSTTIYGGIICASFC